MMISKRQMDHFFRHVLQVLRNRPGIGNPGNKKDTDFSRGRILKNIMISFSGVEYRDRLTVQNGCEIKVLVRPFINFFYDYSPLNRRNSRGAFCYQYDICPVHVTGAFPEVSVWQKMVLYHQPVVSC